MKKIELTISGMTCQSCVKIIEFGLSELAGVQSSKVNFTNKKVSIDYDSDSINTEIIQTKIKELGYETSGNINKETGTSCCGSCNI